MGAFAVVGWEVYRCYGYITCVVRVQPMEDSYTEKKKGEGLWPGGLVDFGWRFRTVFDCRCWLIFELLFELWPVSVLTVQLVFWRWSWRFRTKNKRNKFPINICIFLGVTYVRFSTENTNTTSSTWAHDKPTMKSRASLELSLETGSRQKYPGTATNFNIL